MVYPVQVTNLQHTVSVIMVVASIRTSVAMTTLWASIFMTFLLVMIGSLREQEKTLKAAGGFGIFTSVVAFYCGAAGLWVKNAS
jgi:succinate-acetate transporter protein